MSKFEPIELLLAEKAGDRMIYNDDGSLYAIISNRGNGRVNFCVATCDLGKSRTGWLMLILFDDTDEVMTYKSHSREEAWSMHQKAIETCLKNIDEEPKPKDPSLLAAVGVAAGGLAVSAAIKMLKQSQTQPEVAK